MNRAGFCGLVCLLMAAAPEGTSRAESTAPAASGSSAMTTPPAKPAKPLKIRVYNYPDFLEPGGKTKDAYAHEFGVGDYDLKHDKFGGIDWNNRITSIKVPKGLWVTLFKGIFEGRSLTLDVNEDKLGKTMNNEVSSMVVTTEGKPEADKIQFVGTKHRFTVAELRAELAKSKRTLVAKDKLGKNECTIVYPNASATDLSADMGGLVCGATLADGSVKISMVPVYGGCDIVEKKGYGSGCEVGIAAASISVLGQKFAVRGPSAKYCGKVSQEMTCLSAGATVADASLTLTDGDGNAIGAGVSVGVGAGIAAGEKNGVVTAAIDLKIGIGVSLNLSVNWKKDGKAIYKATSGGYAVVEKNVVGAGSRVLNAFRTDPALKGVRKMDKAVVSTMKSGGKLVIQAGSLAKDGVEQIAVIGKKSFWSDIGDALDPSDWF